MRMKSQEKKPAKRQAHLTKTFLIRYIKTSVLYKKTCLPYNSGDDEHLERTVLVMNQSTCKDESISKTYAREFHTAMIAYAVLLLAAVFLIKHGSPSAWWRIPLALTPMIPIFFAVRAFLRFFHRIDELQRRIQSEALALSFGVTCVVTFSYGLLEYAGFPPLSWIWIPPFMMMLWGMGVRIASRWYQ